MNGPFFESSMKYFSRPQKESLIKSFCQRGKNWVIFVPHDTNYPITSSQGSPKTWPPPTRFGGILAWTRGIFARWIGVLKSVGATGRYCLFVVLAKWLNFSAHCAFPFVFSLFARNRSRERRKRLGAREITAICQMRNITTGKANTARNTITKLSSESKRNLSTSWLLRNPKKD